jgi:hypothetical protein
MAQLSDEDKGNEIFAQYQTLPEFAGAFKELKTKVDSKSAPENVDAYELELPDNLPEEYKADEATAKAFREFAKEHDLTKAQAKEAYKWFNQLIIDQFNDVQKAADQHRKERLGQLKKDWGDEFNAKYELMKRSILTFGTPELLEYLDSSGLGNNAALIEAFVKIGEAIGEDQLEPGRTSGEDSGQDAMLSRMYPSMQDLPERRA